MRVETGIVKRALRRDEGYPIGQPAPLYILCECGGKVPVPVVRGLPMTYQCACGVVYDAQGWIVSRPEMQP